jgi:hypothetical protein
MNPVVHLSPRIAMFHAAVSLLPHFASRPLGELSKRRAKQGFGSGRFDSSSVDETV